MNDPIKNERITRLGTLWAEIRKVKAEIRGVDISEVDEAMPMDHQENLEFWRWAKENYGVIVCPSCGKETIDFSSINKGDA